MSTIKSLSFQALVLVVLLTSSARAFTAFWQEVTISPAAIADDPALASMVSYQLMVSTDSDWLSAGMRIELPAGHTFYQHPIGGVGNPNPAIFPARPGLEYTTHVSSPADNGTNSATLVLGGYPLGVAGNGSASSVLPGTFAVAWGDLATSPPGLFEIARLTWPASLPILGMSYDHGRTSQDPNVTIVIPTPLFIPEPAGLPFLGIITAAGAARRATRRHRAGSH